MAIIRYKKKKLIQKTTINNLSSARNLWRSLELAWLFISIIFFIDNCWAIAFRSDYYASVNINKSPSELLTLEMIMEGVGEWYQLTGHVIDRMSNAIPFMKRHCEYIVIHRRSKRDNYGEYGAFETFIISLLKKGYSEYWSCTSLLDLHGNVK